MVIKEDVIDSSIFEEAYYEDPELQIKKWVEKLYGELPILKSSSNNIYSIHPHRVALFHQKLEDFLNKIEELPNKLGYRLVIKGAEMDRKFWKTSILDFVRHMESIWMVSGPVIWFVQSEKIEEGDGENDLSVINSPIAYVCEIPSIYSQRIETFRISLLDYLFTYKNDGQVIADEENDNFLDENRLSLSTTDWDWNIIVPQSSRRNREDVTLGSGYSIISWVLFEKILGLLDENGIIAEFENNPEITKKLSDAIWITEEGYFLYQLEYFLLNIWNLNEPGFWGRILSFFESNYMEKTRFLNSFRRLLLLEIPPSDLFGNVENSPATSSDQKVLNFWDIHFTLGEKGYIKVGHSESINANTREFVKTMVYGKSSTPEIHNVPIKLYDFKWWIKLLYAMIKYGKDYPDNLEMNHAKVYTEGTKSLAKHIHELANEIPKLINHNNSETEDIERIDNLVSLASKVLYNFDSEMTMRKKALSLPWVKNLKMKDGRGAPVLARKKIEKSSTTPQADGV